MTKADDVYLEDITENTLDFAPEVADSLGMSLSEYLKLSLPQRIDLTEKFIWQKKQGGFVNGYQNKNKINFDEGGVLQGYADEGFVSLTEEFETMTIDKALEKLAKKESAQAKKGIYKTAEKQLKVVFKEIFPDIVFDKILLKNISVDDTAKFLHLMDKNNFGEKSINTFSALFKHGGLKSPVTTLKELGKYEEYYTRAGGFTGTALQRWDDKSEKAYKKLLEWTDNVDGKGLKPTLVPKAANGSINRLAKIQLLTGLHTVDIVRLRPSDISDNGFIRFLSSKGGPVGDALPVSDEVIDLLKIQLAAVGGAEGVKDYGGRLFGRLGDSTSIATAEVVTNATADAYTDAWSQARRNTNITKKIQIFDGSLNKGEGGYRALTFKDARHYHAYRLKEMGESKWAHAILGWADKEEGTKEGSKMFKKIYSQTADSPLKVNLEIGDFSTLKQVANSKEDEIRKFTNYKVKTKLSTVKPPGTLAEQVSKITEKSELEKLSEQAAKFEDVPEETIISKKMEEVTQVIPEKEKIVSDITEELPKKAKVSVSGEKYTELPKENSNKIKLALQKAGKTGRLATLLTLLSKIGGAVPVLDPVQWFNEAAGGNEGILPTTESGNILGFIPPTTSKEAESWTELLGIPTYPKGHPKEGQHILSTKEYEQMKMPEELEQFEQQGRL